MLPHQKLTPSKRYQIKTKTSKAEGNISIVNTRKRNPRSSSMTPSFVYKPRTVKVAMSRANTMPGRRSFAFIQNIPKLDGVGDIVPVYGVLEPFYG